MMRKFLGLTLCGMLLIAVNAPLISAQTNPGRAEPSNARIKARIAKRGTGEKKRVKVTTLAGAKLKGYISQIGDDSFTLTDSKTRRSTVLNYADVASVKGSGSKKIILGVTIGAVVVAVVIVASLFARYCNNEGGC